MNNQNDLIDALKKQIRNLERENQILKELLQEAGIDYKEQTAND